MLDIVQIIGAKYSVNLGVSEKERANKQTVILDLSMNVDISVCTKSDEIKDAVNWSEVNALIKELVESKEYKLLEKMIEEISELLLSNFPVEKVELKLKKPAALCNAEYTAVKIVRTRK
ncbi:dihydroneopterin aldolase [archaeon]|jgi:7,8-dihydroneopterin aldolase/epimerase/oxygenase|nr:dihydroneopterin aldolase [archaeon]MBT6762179.1 dihydroneopterin aldolase [archaeon]